MAGTEPYIGSTISLISKAEIRYEGTLYGIDPTESTVTLSRGECAWEWVTSEVSVVIPVVSCMQHTGVHQLGCRHAGVVVDPTHTRSTDGLIRLVCSRVSSSLIWYREPPCGQVHPPSKRGIRVHCIQGQRHQGLDGAPSRASDAGATTARGGPGYRLCQCVGCREFMLHC